MFDSFTLRTHTHTQSVWSETVSVYSPLNTTNRA